MNKDIAYAGLRASLAVERRLFPHRLRARATILSRQNPVVIMGRGKSGTRLLPLCLSALGVAMATRKSMPAADVDDWVFRKVVKRMARRNLFVDSLAAVDEDDLRLFQKTAWRLFQRMQGNPQFATGWGWKYPETYLIVPYVYKTFPNARFIHIVRDGRDVAFRRHLTDDTETPLGRQILGHLGVMDQPRHIRAALSWQFQVEKYQAFAEQIPADRRLDLRFEDLCADPVAVMGQVAEFLGLTMSDEAAATIRGIIRPGTVSQYREESDAQVQEVERLVHETLTSLSYLPAPREGAALKSR